MFILCLDIVDLTYVLGGAQTLSRGKTGCVRGEREGLERKERRIEEIILPPTPTPRVLMRLISLSQHLPCKLQSVTKLVETFCLKGPL